MASILVIEDDAQVRSFLRTILALAGHDVREAADGAEGLRALERMPADLVLCDLFMPDVDGLEVLHEGLGRWPGTKFVAMSGGAFGGRLAGLTAAEALGAAAVLHKPFRSGEVLELVRQLTHAAAPGA